MRNLTKSLVLILILGYSPFGHPQKIEYDWQSNGSGAPLIWPTNITKTQPVPFIIDNTNNLLYTYSVSGSCTKTQVDPWGTVAPIIAGSKPAAGDMPEGLTDVQKKQFADCATDLNTAIAAWNKVPPLVSAVKTAPAPTGNAKCTPDKPCRISLATSQGAWRDTIATPLQTAITNINTAINSCRLAPQSSADAQALKAQADQLQAWYDTPHNWTGNVSIIPDSNCTFTISESYQGNPTTPTVTVTFAAGQPELTLSAGPLFSEIQDRSYSVVTAPPASGSSTNQSLLQVNGRSVLTTYLTGLLNFSLPFTQNSLNGENGGLAISTGPVLRVGGQSTSSAFGWYTGLSYHLYHYLYVSAGTHIGQFADFPAGFTAANQTVPSGFPTPVAQNRTTARFAFAITLKAKDFSALGTSAKASAPAAQPSKPK